MRAHLLPPLEGRCRVEVSGGGRQEHVLRHVLFREPFGLSLPAKRQRSESNVERVEGLQEGDSGGGRWNTGDVCARMLPILRRFDASPVKITKP